MFFKFAGSTINSDNITSIEIGGAILTVFMNDTHYVTECCKSPEEAEERMKSLDALLETFFEAT